MNIRGSSPRWWHSATETIQAAVSGGYAVHCPAMPSGSLHILAYWGKRVTNPDGQPAKLIAFKHHQGAAGYWVMEDPEVVTQRRERAAKA